MLQLFNLVLGLVNFVIATLLIMRSFSVSQEIGAASTAANAQATYEDLLDDRADLEKLGLEHRFYNRLWAAQALQFEQWRRRLVPDFIYCDWLTKRREQYVLNEAVGKITFRDSWNKIHSTRYQKTDFAKFIEALFEGADVDSEPVDQSFMHARKVMKRYRRSRFMRF